MNNTVTDEGTAKFWKSPDSIKDAKAKLIDVLISTGVSERATDVHFEPEKNLVRVRYRIDGVLKQGPYIPKKLERAINSRISVLPRSVSPRTLRRPVRYS